MNDNPLTLSLSKGERIEMSLFIRPDSIIEESRLNNSLESVNLLKDLRKLGWVKN
jgi:hypothetical protein